MKINHNLFLFLIACFCGLVTVSCNQDDDFDTTAIANLGIDSISEVENATLPLNINVGLNNARHAGGTISVSVTGGTYGTDYETPAGSADFVLDIDENTLSVPLTFIFIDNAVENDPVVLTVTLTGATGSISLGDRTSFTLTILDNEGAPEPTSIGFDAAQTTYNEDAGSVTVALALSQPALTAATAEVVFDAGSSATLGSDFTVNGGSDANVVLDIAAGATTAEFTIEFVDDTEEEDAESIVLTLGALTGDLVSGGTTEVTLNILDNDSAVTPINYLETFESFDGDAAFLNDVLGFENILINQTIDAVQLITLKTTEDKFADADDPTLLSDNGLDMFYNSAEDPTLFGDLDNALISPAFDAAGLVDISIDAAYGFKNQNNATVTYYWSESYDGGGTFNESDWTVLGTTTAQELSDEGFGNNDYKRTTFTVTPSGTFHFMVRITQTIDETFYRSRFRFDNLRAVSQ